jgi:uroporphyrinogen decarboxylase
MANKYTGKERILCAFNHQKADRLPVFDIINKPGMYDEVLGVSNTDSRGRPTVRLAKALGMDAVTVHSAPYTCLIPPKSQLDSEDTFTDRFGIRCKITDASWPLGMAINPREISLELVELIENMKVSDEDIQEVVEGIDEANNEIAVFGSVRGAFGFLFILLGPENLSIALYEEPELLHRLIEASDTYWTQLGLKLIEAGCTALYVANDLGMNGQTLISPAHLREFFFPSMHKQIQAWKQAGGRILLHSCGNVDAVLEDLADMGIDAITNIQVHAGMNLASVKKRIGDRVTIVGNVDATGVLCQSDQQLIANAIREVIDTAGQDGALIIATDHSFHAGIPSENVHFFIEKSKELGKFDVI